MLIGLYDILVGSLGLLTLPLVLNRVWSDFDLAWPRRSALISVNIVAGCMRMTSKRQERNWDGF